ncbi:HipA domain-containing protein [Sphingopyxis sp. NJF-3]
MSELAVWWDARRIGTLARNAEGTMLFAYDAGWLADPAFRPISASLPGQAEPFSRAQTRPFFAGLLPDEGQRAAAAQAAGVSRQNDYALLDALGGDVAGALVILPEGQPLPAPSPLAPEALAEDELAKLLDELPRRPFLVGDEGIRMSLAGAQPKLPVVLVDGVPALPSPGQPTTHIVKPAIARFANSVETEAFAMRLAAGVGLDVARVEPRRAGAIAYLLVERFDRRHDGTAIRRIHQEDFCQALGIAPENKYAIEGGPGFAACFDLVRRICTTPARDLLRLLDAAIFNAVIGNADAHGKNFSLLYGDEATVLAPLYDLMVTAYYPEIATRFAMPIGRANQLEALDARAWERFAADMELAVPFVRRRVDALATRIRDAAPAAADTLAGEGCDPDILSALVALVAARADAIGGAL